MWTLTKLAGGLVGGGGGELIRFVDLELIFKVLPVLLNVKF